MPEDVVVNENIQVGTVRTVFFNSNPNPGHMIWSTSSNMNWPALVSADSNSNK